MQGVSQLLDWAVEVRKHRFGRAQFTGLSSLLCYPNEQLFVQLDEFSLVSYCILKGLLERFGIAGFLRSGLLSDNCLASPTAGLWWAISHIGVGGERQATALD